MSLYPSSIVDSKFDSLSSQTKYCKNGICHFSVKRVEVKTWSGWIEVMIMCPSGAAFRLERGKSFNSTTSTKSQTPHHVQECFSDILALISFTKEVAIATDSRLKLHKSLHMYMLLHQ